MSAVALKAHAKINIYLEVGEKANTGYHEITSVMQCVTLCDLLEISPADEIAIVCDDDELSGSDNLVAVAARNLSARYAPGAGALLRLTKRIPVGAGLGGGSADAAAALIGLNRLWQLGLSVRRLTEVGAEIGSDVPFFLTGGAAFVTGFGETVEPLPTVDLGPLLIIKPRRSLSTAAVYDQYDRLDGRMSLTPDPMLKALESGERARIFAAFANGLENSAIDLLPEIGLLKKAVVEAGAQVCMVSGSGSALVAAGDRLTLRQITERLGGEADVWQTNTCATGVEFCDAADALRAATA